MPTRKEDFTLTEIVVTPDDSLPPSTEAVLISDPADGLRPAAVLPPAGDSRPAAVLLPAGDLRPAGDSRPAAVLPPAGDSRPAAVPLPADGLRPAVPLPADGLRPAVPLPTVRHMPTRPTPPQPQKPERAGAYSALLTRVAVYPWPQKYNYYQRFSLDAERLSHLHGTKTDPVPYFSYIPQYSQLGREQLQFYLWFREQSRGRIAMEGVDFPYILLYIYEIINLPSIPPVEGADTMAWLWLTYRRRFAELDKYLSEWMCDYCLVHAIPCPASLSAILPEIVRRASLKEFYLAPMEVEAGEGLPPIAPDALIALASDYSYRASKYYEANAEAYDTHIPAAVEYALRACSLYPDITRMRTAHAERDAFCGSLCAQLVKRRVRVEYRSFARSIEVRGELTAAVKLAENQMRARLKIRPRLGTGSAPAALAAAVAAWFDEKLPQTKKAAAAAEERAYERLYDAPDDGGMDLARSREIEAASWANTILLAPEEPPAVPVPPTVSVPSAVPVPPAPGTPSSTSTPPAVPVPPTPEAPAVPPTLSAPGIPAVPSTPPTVLEPALPTEEERDLLRRILAGESLSAWCRAQKTRTDPAAIAARLNDYAADTLGDVILEADGSDWRLIEDYREDVRLWITT